MMQAVRTDENGKTAWRDMGSARFVRTPSSASLRAVAQMGDFCDGYDEHDDELWDPLTITEVIPDR